MSLGTNLIIWAKINTQVLITLNISYLDNCTQTVYTRLTTPAITLRHTNVRLLKHPYNTSMCSDTSPQIFIDINKLIITISQISNKNIRQTIPKNEHQNSQTKKNYVIPTSESHKLQSKTY